MFIFVQLILLIMSDTPTSSATLKTYFETGDTPTESQFSDFISSSRNTVDSVVSHAVSAAFEIPNPDTVARLGKFYTTKLNASGGNWALTYGDQYTAGFVNLPAFIYNFEEILLNWYWNTDLELWQCVGLLRTGAVIVESLNYKAHLNQAGTANPTVLLELNNSIVTMAWTREAAGQYRCTPSIDFDADNTIINVSNNYLLSAKVVQARVVTPGNYIRVDCYDDTFTLDDDNDFSIDVTFLPQE